MHATDLSSTVAFGQDNAITRRHFLQGVGAAGATLVMTSVAGCVGNTNNKESDEMSTIASQPIPLIQAHDLAKQNFARLQVKIDEQLDQMDQGQIMSKVGYMKLSALGDMAAGTGIRFNEVG